MNMETCACDRKRELSQLAACGKQETNRKSMLIGPAGPLRFGTNRAPLNDHTAAGCKFEFSEKTIQPLAKMLREELKKL